MHRPDCFLGDDEQISTSQKEFYREACDRDDRHTVSEAMTRDETCQEQQQHSPARQSCHRKQMERPTVHGKDFSLVEYPDRLFDPEAREICGDQRENDRQRIRVFSQPLPTAFSPEGSSLEAWDDCRGDLD